MVTPEKPLGGGGDGGGDGKNKKNDDEDGDDEPVSLMGGFVHMHELYLNNNPISSIPSLDCMKELKLLDLSFCQLENTDVSLFLFLCFSRSIALYLFLLLTFMFSRLRYSNA
jgi:hypothetical protein